MRPFALLTVMVTVKSVPTCDSSGVKLKAPVAVLRVMPGVERKSDEFE